MLNPRQEEILFVTVQSYIDTGEPVSSQYLLEVYDLNVSSATIRSTLYTLEEQGYLHQLHTSSGRVPTDAGYRFYVNRIRQAYALSRQEQARIVAEYQAQCETVNALLDRTVRFAARLLSCTTLATTPREDSTYLYGTAELLDHPEFQDVHKIRGLVGALEEKEHIVQSISPEVTDQSVMLRIGAENHMPELCDCSIMATRYHVKDHPGEILSVITTKRTDYNRVTRTMQEIVSQMDRLMESMM